MAYTIDGSKVQRITVEAIIAGQRIIDRFHLALASIPPDADVSTSDVLLTSFQAKYRSAFIPIAWDDYAVYRYKCEEVSDVTKPDPTKKKYRTIIDPLKFDELFGAAGDVGTIPSAGTTKLPVHECLRLLQNPVSRVPKRFRGNYLFMSIGQAASVLSNTSKEQWLTSFLTTSKGAGDSMAAATYNGVNAPIGGGYKLSVFSPPFWYEVIRGMVANSLWYATRRVANTTAEAYVGVRKSRAFKPLGGFHGI